MSARRSPELDAHWIREGRSVDGAAMGDKLARIFEYRVLYAKQRELQIPLTRAEQERLVELRGDLPDHVPSADDRDLLTLLKNPLPAQFVAGGRFGSGTLRNGSAIGLAIVMSEEPPALGERLILHVQEPVEALEYTFPCRVIARVVKGVPSMGVVFEGVPSQTRALGRTSGVWSHDGHDGSNGHEDDEPEITFQDEDDTTKVSRTGF